MEFSNDSVTLWAGVLIDFLCDIIVKWWSTLWRGFTLQTSSHKAPTTIKTATFCYSFAVLSYSNINSGEYFNIASFAMSFYWYFLKFWWIRMRFDIFVQYIYDIVILSICMLWVCHDAENIELFRKKFVYLERMEAFLRILIDQILRHTSYLVSGGRIAAWSFMGNTLIWFRVIDP